MPAAWQIVAVTAALGLSACLLVAVLSELFNEDTRLDEPDWSESWEK